MKLQFLSLALALAGSFVEATKITSDPKVAAGKTYDYVLTGAGLCGSVLANKLSAAGHSVLVIERGNDDARTEEAILYARRRNDIDMNKYNYLYPVEQSDRPLAFPFANAGKGIGGSTLINGMVWYRPAPGEMDAVASAAGDSSWNAKSLEPFLVATERFTKPTAEQIAQGATFVESVHGYKGPVNSSFSDPLRVPKAVDLYQDTWTTVFGKFSGDKDLSAHKDSVIANNIWSIWHDKRTNEDMRSSANLAYMYPAKGDVTVLIAHSVEKVLFNGRMQATGVTFGSRKDKMYTVKAAKEVILTAGALASPAILQRSGVGAAVDLKAAKIKQLIELPGVGKNLYDQPGTTVSASMKYEAYASGEYNDNSAPFAPIIAHPNAKQVFGDDFESQRKKLAFSLVPEAKKAVAAGAFVDLASAAWIYAHVFDELMIKDMPIVEIIGETYPYTIAVPTWPSLPFSCGYLRATSASAFDNPVINPRYLSFKFDRDMFVASSKKIRESFSTKPLANIVDSPTAAPAANVTTDAQWEQFLLDTSYGADHWGGTTAMMPLRVGGVVDSKLKVYKTRGLRVIDAGVVPIEISAHTSEYLYALALRGASLVLQDA